MSHVAVAADKRFRRAHVKPGRRRRSWRRVAAPVARYAVIGAAIALGIYEASGIAAQAHALRIEKIAVKGNERVSKAEIARALDGLVGQSLVWTDLNRWRDRLMQSPWIRDVAMRRSLPSTIEVFVSERLPMGLARIHGELFLMDDHGVILDQNGPQYKDFDLPIVDGLSVHTGENGTVANEAGAELAARVIASLKARPAIAAQLQQVDVSDVHNAAVILNDDPAVIQLGEDQFLPRVESYLGLASALRERVAHIDYVDVRFDDRIYVRPSGKKAK
jgi:cell division septal protein FtsQ